MGCGWPSWGWWVTIHGSCNLVRSSNYSVQANPSGGRVRSGWARAYSIGVENNAILWLHLASWNLPDSQLSWASKMEPSVAIWCGELSLCFHHVMKCHSWYHGMVFFQSRSQDKMRFYSWYFSFVGMSLLISGYWRYVILDITILERCHSWS